jgi:hypothetical protein
LAFMRFRLAGSEAERKRRQDLSKLEDSMKLANPSFSLYETLYFHASRVIGGIKYDKRKTAYRA